MHVYIQTRLQIIETEFAAITTSIERGSEKLDKKNNAHIRRRDDC